MPLEWVLGNTRYPNELTSVVMSPRGRDQEAFVPDATRVPAAAVGSA
jgi:hypothetical protein